MANETHSFDTREETLDIDGINSLAILDSLSVPNSEPFMSREDLLAFVRTDEKLSLKSASRGRNAIGKGFMLWSRVVSSLSGTETDEFALSKTGQAYADAWDETGLEMVYSVGSPNRIGNFVLNGYFWIDPLGPTLKSLHSALLNKTIFALYDFGPGAADVLTDFINFSVNPTIPLNHFPHSEAVRTSTAYSKLLGFYPQ